MKMPLRTTIPIVLLCFMLAGCEWGYYMQAVSGHFDILNKKQNIEELIENPETKPELVRKLKLLQEVRQYAVAELHLPDVHGYTEYADIGRSYVSSLVTASEPLRFEAYEWCFLFAGCVEYRGYFDDEDTKTYAKELAAEGFDVAISYARAYSTLGWLNNSFVPDYFKDPVLNTFVQRDDVTVIKTLIHEMAHQVVYIPGDTPFNESFAVFVEEEGVKRYLESVYGPDSKLHQRYLHKKKDQQRFRDLVHSSYDRLKVLYDSELSDEEKREQKKVIFAELKTRYQESADQFKVITYRSWFKRPLNNAHVQGVRRYYGDVYAFSKLFEQQNREWPAFFEAVKSLADLSKEEREAYFSSGLL